MPGHRFLLEEPQSLLGWIAAWGVGLVALAALLLPLDLWRDFLTTSRLMAGYSLVNPYNGSVDGILHGWSTSLATRRRDKPTPTHYG